MLQKISSHWLHFFYRMTEKLDINSASLEEWMSISGVGPARARAILRHKKVDVADSLIEIIQPLIPTSNS